MLTSELPHTFAALATGRVSEWRAMLVARETVWLSRDHRVRVDAELAPKLERLGDKRVAAETKRLAYALDPEGFVARSLAAANDRRVTLRPAPDTMARLTALLPVAQAVACYATLARHADGVTNGGDERGRGQILADTLVERITGQTTADQVPVEVHLIMSDDTLLDPDSPEPAQLDGYGPIPTGIARALALGTDAGGDTDGDRAPRWLRRLFRHPGTGQLIAMERQRRHFSAGQRRFVRTRDQYCRTPWCEAPIRHVDHIVPAAAGGSTSVTGGQGYCEACNYTKQAPGWVTRVRPGISAHEVETITPTGHRYRSRPPDPPGTRPPESRLEHRMREPLQVAARRPAA